MKKVIGVLCSLLVIVFVITGCSGTNSSSTTLSPAAILSKSYNSMQSVNSFHFVLKQVGGGTPITSGIEMTGAEGDIVRPDKMQTTIDGTAMGTSIEVKMVTTGGKTVMTNPLSGAWETPPAQFAVLSVFDPGTGIAAIIKGMTDPASLTNEQVGDTLCYHLKGGIASEALKPITGSAVTGTTISAEVWIGTQDFLVRQVKLTGKITDGENDGIVRTLTLSNFNQNVNITLPQ